MATTTNFGWETPDDTDLVKDGALAMRTLGNAIDTSLVDLKGGTTGQVLSKTSNTDMDFTWVTSDDANAIQNTIVDAKGDLITATGSDVPARLAVGNNGDTLLADSASSVGLRWSGQPAASNPVINGAFDVWQRGTSILATNSATAYQADRWQGYSASSNVTVSRQATTDTTNLPNIQYCARSQRTASSALTGAFQLTQNLETVNSIPYAGKTVTLSFYARAGANYSSTSNGLLAQIGSGTGTDQNAQVGYTGAAAVIYQTATLTTTWQRFTYTGSVASTATELYVGFGYTPTGTAGANDYFEVTGVQIDIGNVALPFRRSGNTLQGELAACQRYYWRMSGSGNYAPAGVTAVGQSATGANGAFSNPVSMRTNATAIEFSNLAAYDGTNIVAITAMTLDDAGITSQRIGIGAASGLTQYRPYLVIRNNNSAGYLAFSAEL